MKQRIIHHRHYSRLFQALSVCLLLVGLPTLWACTADEPGEPVPAEGQTLTGITLQLGPSGTTTTRAYGGDEHAREGEFISTLKVVVVDKYNKVEWVGTLDEPTNEEKELADKGKLTSKEWKDIALTAGKKTIYAFANMEGHGFSSGDDLPALLQVGKTFDYAEWKKIAIDDPAGTLNKQGEPWKAFIPMTARQEVNLSTNNQTVKVELVRMVSRIDLEINNTKGSPITLTELSIGQFAGSVNLFDDGTTLQSRSQDTNVGELMGEGDATVGANSKRDVSFYVNATEDGKAEPFSVKARLQNDERAYTGSTTITQMPRNNILPLALNFSNYDLVLTVQAQIAPIGGYPVDVFSGAALTNRFSIDLPEGCTFTISPKVLKDNAEQTIAYTWAYGQKGGYDWLNATSESDNQPFAGVLSARKGNRGELKLSVKVDGTTTERNYTLQLNTVAITSSTLNPSTLAGAPASNHWTAPARRAIIFFQPN